ncbi:dead-box atp-dependent rna helicase 39-like [Stylonychia lemnae]|uniref:Dead-box atp-dependent rna helicase 39-like n=1 Tax=Stylonychia lemnae TaxID=5949 RepID=A0A078AK30_STYLE|nr:dead-box atp-dependent rna helicase 39-like [Stylonychia lemnae]|eukprot:CDW82256.1 dead-box atp-dependent rna helicase 39-like [Stylonychia lemnae]
MRQNGLLSSQGSMRLLSTFVPNYRSRDNMRNTYVIEQQKVREKIVQPEIKQDLTFRKYRLLPEIVDILEKKMEILTPSPIQQMAIPHLLQSKSALLAAQTGTGKTLAYVIPIIDQLKKQEMENQTRLTIPNKPRSIILQPSRELAQQVLNFSLKPFTYDVPMKYFSIYSGQSHRIETDKLADGVDILVSTLERFQYRRDGEKLFLSNVQSLVIDELDTFLDSGHEIKIRKIIEQYLSGAERQGVKKQLIFSTATVTSPMDQLLKDYFPDSKDFAKLVEKHTHMNLSHLKHEFIKLADYDKMKPLLLLVKEYKQYALKNETSCVIFCNSVASARAIEHGLANESYKTASLHGEMPPRIRMQNFERFLTRKADILVASDLASRGLDMPFVSHIINFDFPKSTSDYLHRAGRAGRAGRPGFVMSLVREKDNPILTEMKKANELQEPLKIKGSAFSLKNKETLIQQNKQKGLPVNIGTKTEHRADQNFKGSAIAPINQNQNVSKTFKAATQERMDNSLKNQKEKIRVLHMKSKPRSRNKIFEEDNTKSQKKSIRFRKREPTFGQRLKSRK